MVRQAHHERVLSNQVLHENPLFIADAIALRQRVGTRKSILYFVKLRFSANRAG